MRKTDLTFVTGATGNLGNAIVRELLKNNRKVRCLVRDKKKANYTLPSSVEFSFDSIIENNNPKFGAFAHSVSTDYFLLITESGLRKKITNVNVQ